VFVGAGISNLYCAWMYRQKLPSAKIIFLEKSHRVGGRVAVGRFCGVDVVKGAGVGRFGKDKLLFQLLKELSIPVQIIRNSRENLFLKKTVGILEKAKANAKANADYTKGETFRDFAVRVLGQHKYDRFVVACGYSDFESYDPEIALKWYGFDDLYGSRGIFIFSWKRLLKALTIGQDIDIRFGQNVDHVEAGTAYVGDKAYKAKNICIGIPASGLRKLFHDVKEYAFIGGQPFIRVYAKLDKPLPIAGSTVVDSHLQKIIPISHDKLVYMIAYADNKHAIEIRKWEKEGFERELGRLFGDGKNSFAIQKLVKYYWSTGTHYYKPGASLKSNRFYRPMNNIFVVGEAVANNQGWTESAFCTVRKALKRMMMR